MDHFTTPAQLHTPSQSFSESPANAPSETSALATNMGVLVDTSKGLQFKEEYDTARMRLSDQKFNIGDYPDPLLPRKAAHEVKLPKGVTPELEKHLLGVITQIRGA